MQNTQPTAHERHMRGKENVRRWIIDFPCSICAADSITTSSEQHCFTCKQYFCHKCFDQHRRDSYLFDHLVTSTRSLVPKAGLVQVDLRTHGVTSVGGICCTTKRQRHYTIVTDQTNDRVLVLDESYDLSSAYQCYSTPYAVNELPSTGKIAVTMPHSKRLVLLSLSSDGKLTICQTLPTASPFRGLVTIKETFTDTVVATSGERPKHKTPAQRGEKGALNVIAIGEQHVNTTALLHVKQFETSTATSELFPQNVTLDSNKEVLYFTDKSVGAISMNACGKIKSVFATEILGGARGVAVTPDGRLYISGTYSNNVVEYNTDGHLVGEVVTADHGLVCPIALYFDAIKHRLLIGCRGSKAPLKIVRL